MPPIPSITEIVRDYGMGLTSPASLLPVIFGVASAGAQSELTLFNSVSALRDAHGEGPGVEAAANVLAHGGGPVGFIRSDASVAASNGSVSQSGTGPAVTISGAAAIDAHLVAKIVAGGALGTATFKYSCDAYSGDTESERTYSEVLTVPAGGTFAIPGLGITLTFPAGTYVADETYTADVECAASNATDLAAAFAALGVSGAPNWRYFVLVTSKGNGDSAAHATLTASLQSQLTSLASGSKYKRAMMPADAGEDTPAQAVTAFASTTAIRCLVAYGMVRRATTKPFPGFAFPTTHAVDVFAARASQCLPSTDLKWIPKGALEEVAKLFHDEYASPSSLDNNKISTLRTWDSVEGFYVTQGRLKSPSGSDFELWPHGILMDIACETVHAAMAQFIGEGVRTIEGGKIDPRDAARINAEVEAQLRAQLVEVTNEYGTRGHVTDIQFAVDEEHNILADGLLIGEVGILPFRYVDFIQTTLGFVAELPTAAAA